MAEHQKQVNGEKPPSQTFDHIKSYPLVSDSIIVYQNNTIGAHSISLFNSFYATFAEPVLPYLRTPYSVVAPYLVQVDAFGDSTLSHVDHHFPAVKQTNLEDVKNTTVFRTAGYPFKIAGDSKDYVFKTYEDEYQKIGGQGIVTAGMAIVSTELRIASDAMHAFADFIGPKKEEAKKQFHEAKKHAVHKKNEIVNQVNHN